MADTQAYLSQLQALLPQGPAWPRDGEATLTRLLEAMAAELARVDARGEDLVDEADPRTTYELLADWERVAGLPDDCTGEAGTIDERRGALVDRLTATGGQSIAYFKTVAAALGYTIEVREYRPFVTGLSRCGHLLNGGHVVRHTWKVKVPDPRVTLFRTGQAQCGDLLGAIDRADDLECRLRKLKPAQSELVFDYSGA